MPGFNTAVSVLNLSVILLIVVVETRFPEIPDKTEDDDTDVTECFFDIFNSFLISTIYNTLGR